MKDAALRYYDRGWMPIPCRSEGPAEDRKRPLIERWRQYQYVRPERSQIEAWWDAFPYANIALICGRVSGLVVVDFDGAVPDPIQFVIDNGLPRDSGVVQTGGGGFHLYFRHPGGDIKNGVRVGRIAGVPVDVRGDGGYVVAPPSVHGSGNVYAWLSDPDTLPVLPDALHRALDRAAELEAATTPQDIIVRVTEADRILAGVEAGERNHAAARVCGYFLKVTKQDEAATWSMLRVWNRQNRPPLNEQELRGVFQSILQAAQEEELEGLLLETGDSYLLSGRDWADHVRDIPPRQGIPAPSLPTLVEVGGIVSKDLVILASLPGMGKSTAAWGVVYDVALRQKIPTIIFSTEMTSVDVARWVASRMHKRAVMELSVEQWEATLAMISHSPVTICDRGAVTVDYIQKIVEARPSTKLVIVDHIQRVGGHAERPESRTRELELIAKQCKSMAKDMDLCALVLSQLNRAGGWSGGRPTLRALRDSGGLEQEADAVIFIWTEASDPTTETLPVKFYLAKNRHGRMVEIDAVFHKPIHLFRSMALPERLAQIEAEVTASQTLNRILEGEDVNAEQRRHGDDASAATESGDQDALLRLFS